MEIELGTEERQQLAAVYELLSRLWLSEPDHKLLETLSDSAMKSAWQSMGGCVPSVIDEQLIEELAIDYCQLLVGPTNQLAPIQSVWEDETLQSQPTESMYRFFELIPEFKPASSIPDHLAVQLQFLSELLVRCGGNQEQLGISVAVDFFTKHLAWTEEFLLAVKDRANTEFYSALAKLTHDFLHPQQ